MNCGMAAVEALRAAGLDAKVAALKRTVISLITDCGFGMTIGEMNKMTKIDIMA